MASDIFPPELRTMAIVPRWSIVFTTEKDDIAKHSYFVTVYARLIAKLIKWNGPMEYLILSALFHDIDETITGDIVSPVKKQIIDEDRMGQFIDTKLYERLPSIMHLWNGLEMDATLAHAEHVQLIIKAADRLDAVLFLIMEQRRGNTIVTEMIKSAMSLLEAAWRELPGPEALISGTWQTSVIPAINNHYTQGGRGL